MNWNETHRRNWGMRPAPFALVAMALSAPACGGLAGPAEQAATSQAQTAEGTYRLPVPPNLDVGATPLIATDKMYVGDRARVYGSSTKLGAVANLGAGELYVGNDAQLGGILARGPVNLRERSMVWGAVRSESTVRPANLGPGQGPVTQNRAIAFPTIDSVPVTFPPASSGDVHVEPGQSRTMPPGSFARLGVKSRARLMLSSGDYFFSSVHIEPDAEIELDSRRGPVRLFVSHSVKVRGRFRDTERSPARPLIAYFGTDEIALEAPFSGSVIAPNARIYLPQTNEPYAGLFFGKEVALHQGAVVRALPPDRCGVAARCGADEQFTCEANAGADPGRNGPAGFASCLETIATTCDGTKVCDPSLSVQRFVSCRTYDSAGRETTQTTRSCKRGEELPAPSTDPAQDWVESRTMCDPVYWASLGLPSPWEATSNLGVNLNSVRCEDLAADWELYMRHVELADSPSRRTRPADQPRARNPGDIFFALYHRGRGVLRTFVFVANERVRGEGQLLAMSLRVTDSRNMFLDNGHLGYEGGGAGFTLRDRRQGNQGSFEYFGQERDLDAWMVTDSYLSYDPSRHDIPLFLEYSLRNYLTSDVKLKGELEQQVPEQTQQSFFGLVLGTVFNRAGAAFNEFTTVSEAADKLKESAKKLAAERTKKDEAQKIPQQDRKPDPLAEGLQTLAGLFETGAPAVGIAAGFSPIVTSFFSGRPRIGMPPTLISLDGTITTRTPVITTMLPLSSAFLTEIPFYARKHPLIEDRTLGLFNLHAPPKLMVYWKRGNYFYSCDRILSGCGRDGMLLYASASDPRCEYVGNPAADATLTEVRVLPSFTRKGRSPDPLPFGLYGTTDIRPVAPTEMFTPEHAVSPRFIGVLWDKALGDPEDTDNIRTLDDLRDRAKPQVKALFRFRLANGEMFEVVKTYDAEVTFVELLGNQLPPPRVEHPTCRVF